MKDIVISIKENGKYLQVASRRDGWKLTLTPKLHEILKDWLAKEPTFLNLNWKEFEPRTKTDAMQDGNNYEAAKSNGYMPDDEIPFTFLLPFIIPALGMVGLA